MCMMSLYACMVCVWRCMRAESTGRGQRTTWWSQFFPCTVVQILRLELRLQNQRLYLWSHLTVSRFTLKQGLTLWLKLALILLLTASQVAGILAILHRAWQ